MIGQQMPASEDTLRGFRNTMAYAAAAAERSAAAFRKGHPFNCVRGQGRLTLDECLMRFTDGHAVCARDCGCSIGKRAVEKMNNGEIEMPKKFKKGDCGCGKKDVQLDGEGRCYQCRDKARWAAQKAAKEAAEHARKTSRMTPAASKGDTPPAAASAEAALSVQEACGDDQRVGPRVEEAGEKLREVIEADEDAAPDACQGWPGTAGTLVIDGMEFEAFTATRAKASPTPILTVQSGKVFSFNTGAIETFGLARFAFVELFVSADRKSVAFKFSEDSPASGRGVRATDSKDRLRKRIGAQGFMTAFNLDLKGKGPWPLKQPQPGVLVARVG